MILLVSILVKISYRNMISYLGLYVTQHCVLRYLSVAFCDIEREKAPGAGRSLKMISTSLKFQDKKYVCFSFFQAFGFCRVSAAGYGLSAQSAHVIQFRHNFHSVNKHYLKKNNNKKIQIRKKMYLILAQLAAWKKKWFLEYWEGEIAQGCNTLYSSNKVSRLAAQFFSDYKKINSFIGIQIVGSFDDLKW